MVKGELRSLEKILTKTLLFFFNFDRKTLENFIMKQEKTKFDALHLKKREWTNTRCVVVYVKRKRICLIRG